MNVMRDTVSQKGQIADIPLFVDLDGTLIGGDVAIESLLRAARQKGALVSAIRARAKDGLPGLKRSLAVDVPPDIANLPYREDVLTYIREARSAGRKVILATAADQGIAEQVANHLGLFDQVIATELGQNLKGPAKLEAIRAIAPDGFEYLGDSDADIPIWNAATKAGYVFPSPGAEKHRMTAPEKTSLHVAADAKTLPAIFRAIRPHQWAKNVLVFVPILFSHSYGDPTVLLAGLLAFISFSLCASSVYLVNDMVDIEADRRHPTKRNRPFASGELSLKRGILWAGALGLGSLGYAFALLGPMFGAIMCAYLVLTTAYTFWLKQFSTADVVALSLLYTVRILAGAAAISVVPSPWLLSYSLFFFLSLAYMKRYIELQGLGIESVDTKLPSRNYYASDVHLVQIFGIANGALSVLTLAQYVNSQVGKQVYNAPFLLWFVVPLMMFWTYRTWTWASRGKVSDDPVVFALKDRISRICVGLIICTVALARFASFSWAGL